MKSIRVLSIFAAILFLVSAAVARPVKRGVHRRKPMKCLFVLSGFHKKGANWIQKSYRRIFSEISKRSGSFKIEPHFLVCKASDAKRKIESRIKRGGYVSSVYLNPRTLAHMTKNSGKNKSTLIFPKFMRKSLVRLRLTKGSIIDVDLAARMAKQKGKSRSYGKGGRKGTKSSTKYGATKTAASTMYGVTGAQDLGYYINPDGTEGSGPSGGLYPRFLPMSTEKKKEQEDNTNNNANNNNNNNNSSTDADDPNNPTINISVEVNDVEIGINLSLDEVKKLGSDLGAAGDGQDGVGNTILDIGAAFGNFLGNLLDSDTSGDEWYAGQEMFEALSEPPGGLGW